MIETIFRMNTEPLKIIVAGASGRLGQRIIKLIHESTDCQLLAGLVSKKSSALGQDLGELAGIGPINLMASYEADGTDADVMIDFSLASGFDELVDFCVMSDTAMVSGTTGLTQEQYDRISHAAKFIPMMWTSNFSINVQILKNMLQIIKQLNPSADFTITETHHIHKKDAPSGTAISLAQAVDSSGKLTKFSDSQFQLGNVKIEAIRKGEIPGIHEVNCELDSESIMLEHSAHDPNVFAQGALQAARWIKGKPSGFYDLNQVIMG